MIPIVQKKLSESRRNLPVTRENSQAVEIEANQEKDHILGIVVMPEMPEALNQSVSWKIKETIAPELQKSSAMEEITGMREMTGIKGTL